jgi:hypothetical protein
MNYAKLHKILINNLLTFDNLSNCLIMCAILYRNVRFRTGFEDSRIQGFKRGVGVGGGFEFSIIFPRNI